MRFLFLARFDFYPRDCNIIGLCISLLEQYIGDQTITDSFPRFG